MGFGLIGAGAAVSGLIGGYQQGRKFAQDEERFELEKEEGKQRRDLRGLQIKKAQGELDDDDLERDVRKQSDQIVREYEKKIKEFQGSATQQVAPQAAGVVSPNVSAPGIQAPPATEGDAAQFGIPDPAAAQANAVPSQPGIVDPAAQAAAPQQAPQAAQQGPRSIFDLQREMHVALLNNQMRSKKADVPALMKQAFGSARMFKMAETQATMDAMSDFEAGAPQDVVFAKLAEAGKAPAPGTKMVRTSKPLYPGSTVMVPDVEIQLPDGKTVSRSQMARTLMSPDEISKADTQIGQVALTASHYAATEKQAIAESARREKADDRRHGEVMANLTQQAQQQAQAFQLNFDKFQWEQWDRRMRQATGEFERMYGFAPMSESDRLKIEKDGRPGDLEKAEARLASASGSVVAGMIVYDMNRDPRTMRPNANPAEIKQALDAVRVAREKSDASVIKFDQQQRAYVDVGGNRVLIPKPGWLNAAKNKSEPAPSPPGRAEAAGAANPARPGIARPGASLPEYIPGARSMNEQADRERSLAASRASQREEERARQERERVQREARSASEQMSRRPVGTYPGQ